MRRSSVCYRGNPRKSCRCANAQIVVSRAFQVLSDPDKKKKFDQFGGDPDARFQPPPSGGSPFGNFARGGGRPGPMFEEEISPEEMFRQFFAGGGPFGGPFGMPVSPRTQTRFERLRAFMARDSI